MKIRAVVFFLILCTINTKSIAQPFKPQLEFENRNSVAVSVHSGSVPAENALIEIRRFSMGIPVASTYTGQMGTVEFHGLPNGDYEVVATLGVGTASKRIHLSGLGDEVYLQLPESANPISDGRPIVSVNQYMVPKKARDIYRKAEEAAQKRQPEKAESYLARALDAYPQFAEALTLRAILDLDQSRPDAALKNLNQAIAADPSYARAYLVLGAAYNHMGRFDDAIPALERGVSLDPSAWQGQFELGKAHNGKTDYNGAVSCYDMALHLAPVPLAPIHLAKASALLNLKRYPDAAYELQEFLKLAPKDRQAEQAQSVLNQLKAFMASNAQ